MPLCIKKYPLGTSAEDMEIYNTPSEPIKGLDSLARRCGPYKLRDWADAVGLPKHYVDNCWLRVPVTSEALRRFGEEVLAGAADLDRVCSRIDTDTGIYVIEAEEF